MTRRTGPTSNADSGRIRCGKGAFGHGRRTKRPGRASRSPPAGTRRAPWPAADSWRTNSPTWSSRHGEADSGCTARAADCLSWRRRSDNSSSTSRPQPRIEASTRTTGAEPTASSPRSRRGSCRPSAFTCAENSSSSSTPRLVQGRNRRADTNLNIDGRGTGAGAAGHAQRSGRHRHRRESGGQPQARPRVGSDQGQVRRRDLLRQPHLSHRPTLLSGPRSCSSRPALGRPTMLRPSRA